MIDSKLLPVAAIAVAAAAQVASASEIVDGQPRLRSWNPTRVALGRDEIERCVRRRNEASEVVAICVNSRYDEGHMKVNLPPGVRYEPTNNQLFFRLDGKPAIDLTSRMVSGEKSFWVEDFHEHVRKYPFGLGGAGVMEIAWIDRSGYQHVSRFDATDLELALGFVNESFSGSAYEKRALGLPESEKGPSAPSTAEAGPSADGLPTTNSMSNAGVTALPTSVAPGSRPMEFAQESIREAAVDATPATHLARVPTSREGMDVARSYGEVAMEPNRGAFILKPKKSWWQGLKDLVGMGPADEEMQERSISMDLEDPELAVEAIDKRPRGPRQPFGM